MSYNYLNKITMQYFIENESLPTQFEFWSKKELIDLAYVFDEEYKMIRKKYIDLCRISNINPSFNLETYRRDVK